jgi:hypothetical protein
MTQVVARMRFCCSHRPDACYYGAPVPKCSSVLESLSRCTGEERISVPVWASRSIEPSDVFRRSFKPLMRQYCPWSKKEFIALLSTCEHFAGLRPAIPLSRRIPQDITALSSPSTSWKPGQRSGRPATAASSAGDLRPGSDAFR